MTENTADIPRPSRLDAVTQYRVTGMDCQSCVAKIEHAARKVPGVQDVKVSLISELLTARVADPHETLPQLEEAVAALGYKLDCTTEAATQRHVTPAYRRALWIVVALNGAYGIVEIVAGFFAQSQALKADALDFLGDGAITFMGLVALNWSLTCRARTALLQGVFLGMLGVGVLAATLWRFLIGGEPEAEIMGIFGGIALAVNVSAALVLIPHRSGDANVRAVWLFSRNDAIGNAAVVVAAGLVAWLDTPWPDLVVALVIASLFVHSAWSIINDARMELRTARAA